MSDTIKERLARLETMMGNHIAHHEIRDKWMMRILGTLVSSMVLMVVPGFVRWLAGVL
jgi:hypothetical protein